MKPFTYLHLTAALLVGAFTVNAVFAQQSETSISVTPSFAWVTESEAHGHFTVANKGTLTVEVVATPAFGVIGAQGDNHDTAVMVGGEHEPMRDLTDHLTIFPPRMIIEAGQSQTVRYMVPRAATLPEGGYISVISFSMNQRAPIIEGQVGTTSAGVQIDFSLVVPLVLIRGEGQPQMTAEPHYDGSKLTGVLITNVGDFPWTGKVTLTDADGSTVYSEGMTSVFTRRKVIMDGDMEVPDTLRVRFTQGSGVGRASARLLKPEDIFLIR